ncbi:MAG: hypothetical protein ACR652_24310 [Methylocystis sp.]|uniref:hypothetical protein n=1 Tax=Methylocystis sp. TaxID=1911079 RepID=UPI003DA65294
MAGAARKTTKNEKPEDVLLSHVIYMRGSGHPALALTGQQIGSSGKTYASAGVQCALNPVSGMAPMVQAGLYNPISTSTATVSLNGASVATVTFLNPDASVWLANGSNTVVVAPAGSPADSYSFNAPLTYAGQPNMCIPNTSGNRISGDLEYAASSKSYTTVTPGCALNPATGRAQPYVNLFDNGKYLLNVSANDVPLTQLNGSTRRSTPVFLSAGLNVISAANGSLSTDYYVRDGGTGSCTLP